MKVGFDLSHIFEKRFHIVEQELKLSLFVNLLNLDMDIFCYFQYCIVIDFKT